MVLIRNPGTARSNSHSRCELTVRGSHRQFILFHSGTAGRHTAPGAVFRVANAGLRVRRPAAAGCVANSLRHGFPGDVPRERRSTGHDSARKRDLPQEDGICTLS